MKSYNEYINENTAAQRLYNSLKSRGEIYTPKGNIKKKYKTLVNFVEKEDKKPYYEKLKEYVKDEDVYCSFRAMDEIGINPQSTYDTPNGIYTYPVKQMYQNFKRGHLKDGRRIFGSNNPFLYVVKSKYKWSERHDPNTKILSQDFGGATRIAKGLAKYIVEKCHAVQIHSFLSALSYFMGNKKVHEKYDFVKTGYETVVANNSWADSIDPDKFDFYSFFSASGQGTLGELFAFLLMENVDNSTKINIFYKYLLLCFFACYEKDYTLFELTWQLSRELAFNYWNKDNETKKEKLKKDVKASLDGSIPIQEHDVWNHILRNALGFELVINKNEEAIIHPNEPTQAVFLSSEAFTLVTVLDNKRHEKPNQEEIQNNIKLREKLKDFKFNLTILRNALIENFMYDTEYLEEEFGICCINCIILNKEAKAHLNFISKYSIEDLNRYYKMENFLTYRHNPETGAKETFYVDFGTEISTVFYECLIFPKENAYFDFKTREFTEKGIEMFSKLLYPNFGNSNMSIDNISVVSFSKNSLIENINTKKIEIGNISIQSNKVVKVKNFKIDHHDYANGKNSKFIFEDCYLGDYEDGNIYNNCKFYMTEFPIDIYNKLEKSLFKNCSIAYKAVVFNVEEDNTAQNHKNYESFVKDVNLIKEHIKTFGICDSKVTINIYTDPYTLSSFTVDLPATVAESIKYIDDLMMMSSEEYNSLFPSFSEEQNSYAYNLVKHFKEKLK